MSDTSPAAQMWNQRFDREDFLFGTAPNAWLVQKAGHLPAGGRVLCLADGEGRNSVWLAQQGWAVDAFDISEVAVAKARRWAQAQGVTVQYTVASGETAAFPADHYDAVVGIFIQYADPVARQALFRRVVHTLRPGGVFLLLGYTPKQLEYRTGGPPQVSHLYTEAQLRTELPELDVVELQAFEDTLAEGSGHHGRSALIGWVGRKP